MRTELIVELPKPRGGQKSRVYMWTLKNFRIHKALQMLTRMMIFIVESQSNNSSSTVAARDSKTIQLAWKNFKVEWNRAKKYRNAPDGALEQDFKILLLQPGEIMRINNSKLQSVLLECQQLAQVMLGTDSANTGEWVGESAGADIDMQVAICEEVMTETLGDGSADAKQVTGFNVGYEAPDFRIIGTLEPDIDMDSDDFAEPGAGEVDPATVPDSPDVDPPSPPAGPTNSPAK